MPEEPPVEKRKWCKGEEVKGSEEDEPVHLSQGPENDFLQRPEPGKKNPAEKPHEDQGMEVKVSAHLPEDHARNNREVNTKEVRFLKPSPVQTRSSSWCR